MSAGRLGRLVLAACCLSQFIHNVYGSVVNIALPEISTALGASASAQQWIVSAYVLALASLLTLAGTLADRFGRRRILILGNVVMLVGAVVCGASEATGPLIAGRVVQGVGSALIAPAGLSILTTVFAAAQRSAAIVWWTMVGTASLAAGPVLGGLILRDLGWQWVFWAGVPLGVVAIVLTIAYVPESRQSGSPPFDVGGQVLTVLLLAAVAFTLIEGTDLGWTSVPIVVGAGTVVATVVILIPYERRQSAPLVPISAFRDRSFTIGLTTAVLGYGALAGLLYANTTYLRTMRGLDASEAGLMMIPIAVGGTISSWLAGSFVASGRSRAALVLSGALLAVSSLLLFATESSPMWVVIPSFLLFGLGFGLIADPVSVGALSELPASEAGLASSLVSTSKQAGQMLGIAAIGVVLGASATASGAERVGAGVWWLLALCGLAIVALNLVGARSRAPVGAVPRR